MLILLLGVLVGELKGQNIERSRMLDEHTLRLLEIQMQSRYQESTAAITHARAASEEVQLERSQETARDGRYKDGTYGLFARAQWLSLLLGLKLLFLAINVFTVDHFWLAVVFSTDKGHLGQLGHQVLILVFHGIRENALGLRLRLRQAVLQAKFTAFCISGLRVIRHAMVAHLRLRLLLVA